MVNFLSSGFFDSCTPYSALLRFFFSQLRHFWRNKSYAYELEEIGGSKDISGATEKVAALENAFEELLIDLQQLRARLEG